MTDDQVDTLRSRIELLEAAIEPLEGGTARRIHEALQLLRLALAPKADRWRLWQMVTEMALSFDDDALDDAEHAAQSRLWFLGLALGAALAEVPEGQTGDFAEGINLCDELAEPPDDEPPLEPQN